MTQEQTTWIQKQTISELLTSFNKLYSEGKIGKSAWVEWAKIWSAKNPSLKPIPTITKERAWEVFKN